MKHWLIDEIKYIARLSWGSVAKLMIIGIIIGGGWTGYQMAFKGLTFYNNKEVIVFTETKDISIDAAIDRIMDVPGVEVVGLYLYQPDLFPKERVELYKYKGKGVFTKGNDFMHSYDMAERASPYYSRLITRPFISLTEDPHSGYLTEMIQCHKELSNGAIFGLYRFGSPWGAVVILGNNCSDERMMELHNEVRRLNKIMFN